MLDQYREIKEQHPDTVLFFRMGDFYEMFYEDAVIGAETLGITLTSRDKNAENPVPMAGIPWHSVEDYLRKMVKAGHKVTLCEQAPEPLPGEKILRRVVTRVYTPGSLYEDSLIGEDGSALLAAISLKTDGIGLAILDTSIGRAWVQQFSTPLGFERLRDELLRWGPSELVCTQRDVKVEDLQAVISEIEGISISTFESTSKKSIEAVRQHLEMNDLGSIDLDSMPIGLEACGLGASYVRSLHLIDAVPLREITIEEEASHMALDQTTLRNLELTQTLIGERVGSLIHAIDKTRTWMGRRMLKEWILRPLLDREAIGSRHAAIAALIKAPRRLSSIRECLKSMRDLERLSQRLAYDRANARDLMAITDALARMPNLTTLTSASTDDLLPHLGAPLVSLDNMREMLESKIMSEPPATIRDGGIFQSGVDETLDQLRAQSGEGKAWLERFEQEERERLEIPSLKVRYNRQFGYYIEITKTHVDKVPEHYRRRQTLTNAERYTTDDLAEWEDQILNAGSRGNELEYRMFLQLRDQIKARSAELADIARRVAAIDVLSGLAAHARERSWIRPEMLDDERIEITAGRHPVLESMDGFVPNDISFAEKRRFLLLTGPNMGGKSTYLRQTALIMILAQAGSFVPAGKAKLGIVDRVFTRVGAHDDLRRGRSTFMVEMIEVAHILRRATPKSLVLLDEIGRGTSTFDGLAIAWSVTEDLARRTGCRSLFATHYHQLVGLEEEVEELVNIHVQVAEIDNSIRFLHTIAEGPCDDSYGVQVAALAGLPVPVIERARDLLMFLEQQAEGARAGESGIPLARPKGQSSLFGWMLPKGEISESSEEKIVPSPESMMNSRQRELLDRLATLEPDTMTPREALEALYALKAEENRGEVPDWVEE